MSLFTLRAGVLVAVLLLTACSGPGTEATDAVPAESLESPVRGTVVDLVEVPQDGSDLPLVESFTLSTDDQELTFKIGDTVDRGIWNVLHFQGHLRFREPVGVTFEETSDGLVAVMLTE